LSPAPPLELLGVVDAGVVGVVGVLPPVALAPPEADVPDVPEEALPDPLAPEAELLEEPDDEDPVDAVVEVEVVGVVEVPLDAEALVKPPAGTVSAGVPTVSAAVTEVPPPHAARPADSAAPAVSATSAEVTGRARPNIVRLLRSRAAPSACRSAGSR
jgi:hypothetical protein